MPSCFPFSRLCGIQVWAVFNKPSSSACVKLGCKYWLLAWLGWRCLYGILSALKWVQSSPVARVSQPACESPWQDVREPNVTRNAKKKYAIFSFWLKWAKLLWSQENCGCLQWDGSGAVQPVVFVGMQVFPLRGYFSVSVGSPVVFLSLAWVIVCVVGASAKDKILVPHTSGCSSRGALSTSVKLSSINKPLGILAAQLFGDGTTLTLDFIFYQLRCKIFELPGMCTYSDNSTLAWQVCNRAWWLGLFPTVSSWKWRDWI